jgi:hypothetical protein
MQTDVDLIYLAFPVKPITIGNWSECALYLKERRILGNIFLFHRHVLKGMFFGLFGFSYRKLIF